MVFDFPIELERYIFELSASSSSTIASELALVARRVNEWIYPILYGTVKLHDNSSALRFLSSVKSKPSLASYVKSLYIHSEVYSWSAQSVLAFLRNIDNLVCLVSEPRLQKCLDAMRPSRLSILFSGLAYTHTHHTQPDFSHHSFSRVTHLHVFDHWSWWATWTNIHLLPELTHIMLHYDDTIFASDDGQVVKALRDILASCERLQMCVLLHMHPLPSVFEQIRDWELVTMPSPKNLIEGPDIWVAAEKRRLEKAIG